MGWVGGQMRRSCAVQITHTTIGVTYHFTHIYIHICWLLLGGSRRWRGLVRRGHGAGGGGGGGVGPWGDVKTSPPPQCMGGQLHTATARRSKGQQMTYIERPQNTRLCNTANTQTPAPQQIDRAALRCMPACGPAAVPPPARIARARTTERGARTRPLHHQRQGSTERAAHTEAAVCMRVFCAGCGAPAAGRRLALMKRRHHLQSRERPPAR